MENPDAKEQTDVIRLATVYDFHDIDRIARVAEKSVRGSLGWLRQDRIERAIENEGIYIQPMTIAGLEYAGCIGFVMFNQGKRGQNKGIITAYALAVDPAFRRLGIGSDLLNHVPKPFRLKCPILVNGYERNPALDFYRAYGLKRLATKKLAAGNRYQYGRALPDGMSGLDYHLSSSVAASRVVWVVHLFLALAILHPKEKPMRYEGVSRHGDTAIISGTDIPVWRIMGYVKSGLYAYDIIQKHKELPDDAVLNAYVYYLGNREEIDLQIASHPEDEIS